MKAIKLIALTMLVPFSLWSQSVEINKIYPEEVRSEGFTLSQEATVDVTGTGGIFRQEWRTMIFYGWILNSDTREVVWHTFDDMKDTWKRDRDFDRDRDREREGLFDIKTKLELPKGNYELYFAGGYNNGSNGYRNVTVNSLGDVMDNIFNSRRKDRYRDRDMDELSISVSGAGLKEANVDDLINAKTEGSIVSFLRVRDGEDLEKGFTLTGETQLKLYAVGEARRREIFDYVWIRNAATRERVYEMNYRDSEFAGGADKNIAVEETITLPAGSYLVNYVSDDSHNYNDWNSLPPDDPEFWGVTIWPATAADKSKITDFVMPKVAQPLVDLTQIRDDEFVSEGITLSRNMDVRVLCLGEEGSSDRMVDYGWIMNAETREKVWEMDAWDAEPAGGADKNRMVEEKINLPAGDYIVYYVTDGSHAYRDWNATRPHEEDLWGISLWAVSESDISAVSKFNPDDYKNENVIAEITMVGNDKYLREPFTLDADTRVQIIGIGEGDDGDMYDYGYIKNEDTGRIVWEMRYRESEFAGGARKNREFNDSILLEKGSYRLVFESDGSHSYRRWNASPPRNPELWGISVLKK